MRSAYRRSFMSERIPANDYMKSQLGVLCQVLTTPAPYALVMSCAAA
jgi:hypothetical protein